ncbi:MAG: phosphotransferase family protein [Pseudomonadales bacterium]|nr:phosphotransferase family protein [Pseudomonadales bacterium]MBO6596827.1 phosphotransferase family protein [Pseudomonadales bacterium]MBO6703498.1 phosphotransferase family protein [Pseudomonadales bacterium]MBO6823184.1 phosphotransferase family protein [Pseudomonadales bacterium]MBO7004604.1 phosphotransferase family protein [Pseudomonadales bacterium]
MTEAPEGYQVDAVEAWIKAHIPSLTPPFQWTRLEGGHSNLTYRLEDQHGKEAVIRRPPQGQLLPKAHDMSREWALISALGPTPVPVPEALGFCESPDVTGAWFYVMGCINGRPLYNNEETRAWVPEERRKAQANSFVDVLADLHSLDPDDIGLGDLGKRDSYVGRQLKTWYRSWTSSIEGADYDDPRAHELQAFFLNNLPDQGPIRVVHGDYGFHNCLTAPDSTIAAVVDWEISTLGDPLADLAYALNFFPDPADMIPIADDAATNVPGYPTRQEMATRYAERTGRDLSNLDYYTGYNRWKSACIVHGVYARYMEGKKSSEGVDLEHMRSRIDGALTLSEQAVNRLTS